MRIAVYGSWKRDNNELRGSFEDFQAACRQLGAEIARNGHVIAVTSASTSTADYYFVQGVLEAATVQNFSAPVVEVTQKHESKYTYFDEMKQHPALFRIRKLTSRNSEADQLISIREADCVLVIGGDKSSFHAGTAAFISQKTLVPIGAFGGAGAQLLDVMEAYSDKQDFRLLNKEEISSLRGIWTEMQVETVLKALGIASFPKIMIIHGRSRDWEQLREILKNDFKLPAPIVMVQVFGASHTIAEKWEQLARQVHAAIAVATPDDIATATLTGTGELLAEKEYSYKHRARENVWVEVGWFWGRLSRQRILILTRGDVIPPSDLSGIETFTYQTSPEELKDRIYQFIEFVRSGQLEF